MIMCLRLIIPIIVFSLLGCSRHEVGNTSPSWQSLNDSLAIPEDQINDVKKQANSGDGKLSYKLALHYGSYANDIKQGNYWMRRSAEQGNANGQQAWGVILLESKNTDDRKKGVYWLKKAAEQGHKGAINQLKEMSSIEEK